MFVIVSFAHRFGQCTYCVLCPLKYAHVTVSLDSMLYLQKHKSCFMRECRSMDPHFSGKVSKSRCMNTANI